MLRCLGIFREVTNSPNRETDDALILKAVLEQLGPLGIECRAMTPEEFDSLEAGGWRSWGAVLPMCETYPRLKRLASLSQEGGPALINPPESVLNCYRMRMVPALAAHPEVRFPRTEVRSVEDGTGSPPGCEAPEGWWIKRGDVHNTCDRDVVRVRSWTEAAAILKDFAQREITHWVVQPHLPGDLIKFYGVGPGHWFTWFYHDPVRAERHPFQVDDLAREASLGAKALSLEVFGGDAIVSPDGSVSLLDLNSWPSFALVRREAAVQIAWHLQRRLRRSPKKPEPQRERQS